MSHQIIISIKDRATDTFGRPVVYPARGAAIREFQDAINDPQAPFSKHPGDYDLFEIGMWDDRLGVAINLEGGPNLLASGSNLVKA
jgi:hypothetical protein